MYKYFDFYMDHSIKSKELYLKTDGQTLVDSSKTFKFCRGFYKMLSYDFICIHDNKNNNYELIVEPTFKTIFSDANFSGSMSIKYDVNEQKLSADILTTDGYENLIEENYIYINNLSKKSLILISEKKKYNRFYVSIFEDQYKNAARNFYSKGKYSLGNSVEPFEDKIIATTKNDSAFHLLKINGINSEVFVCGGTVMYDYSKKVLDDFQIITNETNNKKTLFINHIENKQNYPVKDGNSNKKLKKVR